MYRPRVSNKPRSIGEGYINPNELIEFLDTARAYCIYKEDEDSALRFECMMDYFKHDWKPGKKMIMSGEVLGF